MQGQQLSIARKIALIGFMGSGKSTVGAKLAEHLGIPFVETDEEVVKLSGRSSTSEIFDEYGEAHFRQIEHTVAEGLRPVGLSVIATGGGFVLSGDNVACLNARGATFIYLKAPFSVIEERLSTTANDRPLFRDRDKAKALYQSRESTYQSIANFTIAVANKSPEMIVQEIVSLISKAG